jgi:hypothetical protein
MVDRERRIIEHRLPEEGWNERERTVAGRKSKGEECGSLTLVSKNTRNEVGGRINTRVRATQNSDSEQRMREEGIYRKLDPRAV